MNRKLFLLLSLIICFTLFSNAQVVINEYSCSNISHLADNYGEFEDWIELYNTGGTTVNLGGYYLSDKANNPTKWQIPNVSIAPGDHKVFYTSGRDAVVGLFYHTNYKMRQTKPEYIMFSDPGGVIIDSIQLTPNQIDHSRGRTTDGDTTWSVFSKPTPDASNTNGKNDYALKPIFSLAAGFYPSTQTITLNTTQPNSEIRYTLNGNIPNDTSFLYTGPITISQTKIVRARTISTDTNILHSFAENNTYFINVTHTLPVISAASPDFNDLFNLWFVDEVMSTFEYFDTSGTLITELDGDFRSHGNDSWAFAQKGIRFYARDQYGYDHTVKHQIFPAKDRDKFDVVIFRNAGSDNYPGAGFSGRPSCHLRDGFCQSLSQKYKFRLDERSYQPCILYLNGQYWGLYEMRERIDADFTKYYYDQPKDSIDMLEYWGGLEVRFGSDTGWIFLANFMKNNNLAVQSNYDWVAKRLNIKSIIDFSF
ncbi:MAG: lamin tail domain-containing protein [Bacteroidetes bacterium]|nr:lamin tail domain-containing protein [Bacteroidota bacterium]